MTVLSAGQLSVLLTSLCLAVILITALICGLIRKGRSFVPALILTGVAIVSAVAAALLCRLSVNGAGTLVYGMLSPLLDGDVIAWLNLMPTASSGLKTAMGILATLLIYIPLFLIIYTLLRIISGILIRVIAGKRDGKNHKSGFFVGLVNGALLGIILLIPLCCLVGVSGGAMQAFFDTGVAETSLVRDSLSDADIEQFCAYSSALSENKTVNALYAVSGKPVMAIIEDAAVYTPTDADSEINQLMTPPSALPCDRVGTAERTSALCAAFPHASTFSEAVATVTVGNSSASVRFSLSRDLAELAEAAGYTAIAADSFRTFEETQTLTEAQLTAVRTAVDAMLKSDWLAASAAEFISTVATEWNRGNACLGLACPEVNELVQPLWDTALAILSDETADRLRTDIDTVMDLMSLLTDIPLGEEAYDALMKKVLEEGLYGKITAVLDENTRLAGLSGALEEVGFRAVTHAIGRDALENGEYSELLNEVSDSLQKFKDEMPEKREEEIKAAVQIAFDKYGIQIPDDIAVSLAEEVLDKYGADGDITADELYDFLLSHYDTVIDYVPEEYIP